VNFEPEEEIENEALKNLPLKANFSGKKKIRELVPTSTTTNVSLDQQSINNGESDGKIRIPNKLPFFRSRDKKGIQDVGEWCVEFKAICDMRGQDIQIDNSIFEF
jgi:hypothetical protein